MIDSHCHVYNPWVKNPVQVIERAKISGMAAVINSSDMPEEFPRILQLKQQFPGFLHVTYGFGPSRVGQLDYREALVDAEKYVDDYVAIGEIGLDYHWIKESALRKFQAVVFKHWLNFAKEHERPVVIHSRKAERDCIEILAKNVEVPVMLHSFAGNVDLARQALDLGYFISIPTSVVERKVYRRIVRALPLEMFMVETDSPWMSPMRGQKNEPLNVKYAIEEIAKLQEVEPIEVERVTDRNARTFYRI